MSTFVSQLPSHLLYHARTAILFTLADIKTIFFPISVFACATGPLHSLSRLLTGATWIWAHQFMCNVSNQARGAAEDARNKPWRPLPAGRITESQALVLRWAAVAVCVWLSAGHGLDVVLATLALVVTTVVYDELGLAGHYVGKNFCNIGGYASFEVGATKLIGASRTMDHISTTAVCISSALIFTTIHAQDFADVAGDRELGRRTLPIHAPELSRRITLVALCAWSAFLCWYWGVGPVCSASYVALGVVIAVRFYVWRSAEADRRSYLLYNLWLMGAHVLPLHARTGVLNF